MTVRHHRYEYVSWKAMMGRCFREKDPYYAIYGGRGITVCRKWLVFENFVQDMGPRPADLTLDRIDINVGYELGNCRWATRKEQNRNRSDTHWIELDGQRRSLAEWCEIRGLNRNVVGMRIRRMGWAPAEALSLPSLGRGYNRNRRLAA